MTRISELLLSFMVNSGWQIVVIFVIARTGSHLLRNARANFRHALWLVALGLSVVAPLWTVASSSVRRGPALRIVRPKSSLARPEASEPARVDGESEDGPALLDRLLVRRKQVVNAQPGSFMLLSAAFALFVLLRVVRIVRSWRQQESLRQNACAIGFNPVVDAAIVRCRSAFGGRRFAVLCSDRTVVPVTLGTLKPLIVLPERFCAEMDDETLISAIGHEVAHISRRDFAINFICELISLPVSFHPLTYLIKREIERAREVACDELVTERLLAPPAYARSLVRVANATVPRADALMLSILDGNILEERIMRLIHARAQLNTGWGRAITFLALSCLCVAFVAITNLSFDLRAYAHSSVAVAPGTNSRTATLAGESEGSISTKVSRRSSPEQSGDTSTAQERARAACEAEQKKAIESIPRLIAMLGDDTKTELIRCWEFGHWSPALESFKHPSPGEQAALALAAMGPPAFEPLMTQLSNPNGIVRRNAAWAIGELTEMVPGARAASVPQLISLLADADGWTRMAAARALGELHDRRATEALVSTLSDPDAKVRELSAWALSEMKDRRAVSALCQVLLTDSHAEVRRTAAEALGEIRSAEALSALKQALNDGEARVRAKVGWAISEIEDGDG